MYQPENEEQPRPGPELRPRPRPRPRPELRPRPRPSFFGGVLGVVGGVTTEYLLMKLAPDWMNTQRGQIVQDLLQRGNSAAQISLRSPVKEFLPGSFPEPFRDLIAEAVVDGVVFGVQCVLEFMSSSLRCIY
ncbi:hypothetical protein NL108_017935 [Boleophthalmus pectinirostris]|uniref:inactive angiotensin-converting enzyme-related protein-like n=1 Tax=Boleophthalmus pectinirostris TaxID=150288 RepID=UPI00242A76E6|nr:inactive angiotensin-converting enzyme-related protein-like [Boleophthalmus pectinirostris]KAJ0060738.1 hypothetical protein NL108_017935 [Boleophthalmus pectinirostris]